MENQPVELLQNLVKLGLTPNEAEVYLLLTNESSLGVKEIGKSLGVLPNAVYRLTNSLVRKNLAVTINQYPVRYQAIMPQIAVEALIKNQENELEELKNKVITQLANDKKKMPQTQINLIANKQEMFKAYIDLANLSQKEILILSIGEQIPEEVILTNRDAKDRGVEIRILIQKYDQINKNLIKSWLKMGWKVRLTTESGFHLMVFDRKRAILMVNNPKEPRERTGIQFFSEGLAKGLASYFDSAWEKAKKIS